MVSEIIDKLKKIGFDQKEIDVYLTCLQEESGVFVVDIVDRTKLKRSTIDVVLNRLVDQGVIGFYFDGKRKRYTAEDPKTLVNSFETTVKDLKILLPDLYSQIKVENKTKIRFYSGEESIFRMFEDIFLTIRTGSKKKELLTVANIEGMDKAVNGLQKKMQTQRLKYKIGLRIFAPDDRLVRALQKDNTKSREIKIFDGNKFPFNASLNIYEDSISLFRLEKNPSGVIIEDADLAESLRSIFNMLWSNFK